MIFSTNVRAGFAAFVVLFSCSLTTLRAQTTVFNYQGRLAENGAPFTGTAEIQVVLWDAADSGVQVASNTPFASIVTVSNGLFTLPLDFGTAPFVSGGDRWLELQVRTAIGPFTTLAPRQKLTATPYSIRSTIADSAASASSVAATNVTGAFSPDQLPAAVAFVDRSQIFTGTNTFAAGLESGGRLAVTGPPTTIGPYDGVGLSLQHNSNTGESSIIASDDNGTGTLAFYTKGIGLFPLQLRMVLDPTGNLGIGTSTPASRLDVRGNGYISGSLGIGTASPQAPLDVRGNIRLGPTGNFFATAGDENLRIVRGMVNAAGAIVFGTGFTINRSAVGTYIINFNTAFSSFPAVTATAVPGVGLVTFATVTDGVTASSATVRNWAPNNLANSVDSKFYFIAVGPR